VHYRVGLSEQPRFTQGEIVGIVAGKDDFDRARCERLGARTEPVVKALRGIVAQRVERAAL